MTPPQKPQQSSFLQNFGEGTRIQGWLWLLSAVIGLGAGLYMESWVAAVLCGVGAYIALSILYAVLAPLLGWPPLRWSHFFGVIIDTLTGW